MPCLLIGSVLALVAYAPTLAQGPAAKVTDLAWMTGHYKGKMGANTLEETWVSPEGGSIGALVRATGGGATNLIELIVIEEEKNSLTLRLKQWDPPGMKPRAERFQAMELVEIGDRRVVFRDTGSDGLQRLIYTLKGDQFTISVKNAQGERDIHLTRQSAH